MKKIRKILMFICIGINLVGCTSKKENPNVSVQDNVESIYAAKNPYIGDISADSKLLGLLINYFEISEEYTMELVTDEKPYVLIVHFNSEPDEFKMWDVSACFLALTDNCSEVRWDYEKNEELLTFYISIDDVNANLNIKDIKDYSQSEEEFNLLLSKLQEN